jgi:addiction module HigA family antidote
MRKRPIYPIHPGEILASELAELSRTPSQLAHELHVSASRISQLVGGRRAMTADIALRLEKWLGVSSAFWMNLQTRYEMDMGRAQHDDSIEAIRPIRRGRQDE